MQFAHRTTQPLVIVDVTSSKWLNFIDFPKGTIDFILFPETKHAAKLLFYR